MGSGGRLALGCDLRAESWPGVSVWSCARPPLPEIRRNQLIGEKGIPAHSPAFVRSCRGHAGPRRPFGDNSSQAPQGGAMQRHRPSVGLMKDGGVSRVCDGMTDVSGRTYTVIDGAHAAESTCCVLLSLFVLECS